MKAFTQALSLRIVLCAAMSVLITGLATQSIVHLAAQPRNGAVGATDAVLVAQSDARPAGGIAVALAR